MQRLHVSAVAAVEPAPLVDALGGVIGAVAADLQREHGVDLRCGVTVVARRWPYAQSV